MAKYRTRPIPPPLPVRETAVWPVHEGRRILLLGAGGYLGNATASLLYRQGASVVLSDIVAPDDAAAVILSENTESGGQCHAIALDLGNEAAISAGVEHCEFLLGGIDGLVNCAAVVPHTDPLAVTRESFEHVFNVNVFGAYQVACDVARCMIRTGTRGSIVNVASEAGKKGHLDSLAYSASKAALISVTRMLSEALCKHDINVNAVCPGGLETPMLHDVARAYSDITGETPSNIFDAMRSEQLGRHLQPAEVARTISFLLSDDAVLIRGQAVNVDAGETVG